MSVDQPEDVCVYSELDEFFNAVEDIEFKNSGGCLFFAYAFWLWLKDKGLPTDSFQIVQYGSSEQIQDNLRWIKNSGGTENCASSSWHFAWKYDGTEYDSEGIHHDYGGVILNGLNNGQVELVEEFCQDALMNGCWNLSFDRNEAIEIIEERLGLDLDCVSV